MTGMALGGASRAGRFAMKMSYRDTRKSFHIGSGKRRHSASSAPMLSSKAARQVRMINEMRGTRRSHPKRYLPRLRPRRRLSKPCFAQDFMAPLVLVMLGVAVFVVAAGVLPINGPGVVVLVVLCAIALIAGTKVANSTFNRKRYMHEER